MNKYLSILLPHCDDEIFLLPFLEKKISEGYCVNIFFLLQSSPIRQNESQKFFSQFANVTIFHWGNMYLVPDGKLSSHTCIVSKSLLAHSNIIQSVLIIAPMFEGGHIDHDEAFLIGYKLSQELKKTFMCFSTYNSYQTPFVRVATVYQGKVLGSIESFSFSFRQGLRYLSQCRFYKSQFVILMVLFPGLVRTFLVKKRIELIRVESFDPTGMHPGRVFYNNELKKRVKTFLMANNDN
jgi:hypothetical protein